MSLATLADGTQVRLGRITPKSRPNVLRFAAYLDRVGATPPPVDVNYSTKAMASLSRVYLNDRLGDCVIAGKYHNVGVYTGNDSGTAVVGTDAEVQSSYRTICGPYDQGCVITEVLDYMKTRGLPLNGKPYRIDGYVAIDWRDKVQVQYAIYLFGAVTIGINLPGSWMNSNVWDVTNSGFVGGHDVSLVGYNAQGAIVSSWGRLFTMTWAAVTSSRYIDEMYALLSPDWYGSDKLAPCGVDADTLKTDLDKLSGGLPPVDPPSPTPPVPPDPLVLTPTTLDLRLSANPVVVGTAVYLTAVVVPAVATGKVPMGVCGFNVDSGPDVPLVPVVDGKAIFALPALPVGRHGIGVTYYGDANFKPSPSKGIAQDVTLAPVTPPPTPVPVPPTPTPTPPAPAGLTLAQASQAVVDGINAGRYGLFVRVADVARAAVAGLVKAWPK